VSTQAPPRDNLIRAFQPESFELRSEGESGMPTLVGYFTRYNDWTEINSYFEGRFLERIAPGAGQKTISEQRDQVRCLFQHGHDPQIGDKPLGPIESLEEQDTGPWYEVPLLDTQYNRELLPGLEAGLYGASFRMQVMREEIEDEPERTEHNPEGLPERTIKEYRLYEFGPVTFPAYPNATAGVRSLTDNFVFGWLQREPERARELVGATEIRTAAFAAPDAPGTTDAAQERTSETPRRVTQSTGLYGPQSQEKPTWQI
jgi:HK97 family phage prohead protease